MQKAEVKTRSKSGAAAKAKIPELHSKQSPHAALQIVIGEALRHLQANIPGILMSRDIEFVHQARIALRRLRSAQKAFVEIAPDEDWRKITADIRWLATLLGRVRDLDVLLVETLPPIAAALKQQTDLKTLKKTLLARHKQCLAELRAGLRSARCTELKAELMQWLHNTGESALRDNTDLRDFCKRSLQKRQRQVEHLAKQWQTLNPVQRHDLRKRAKKLRYTLEFFSPLYKHKPAQRYLKKLRALLDVLGAANDRVSALRQITTLLENDTALAPDANFVIGWLAGALHETKTDLKEPIKNFESAKDFW